MALDLGMISQMWHYNHRQQKQNRQMDIKFINFCASKDNHQQSEKATYGASLVAQWLRIHLPMQETRVQALVREDPTCRRATKPVRHNYWACALQPAGHNYWARVPQLLKPVRLEPVLHNKKSHCSEKPMHRNEE